MLVPGRQRLPDPQCASSAAGAVVLFVHGLPLFGPLRQIAVLKAPCCDLVCVLQKTPVHSPVPVPVQHANGAPTPVHPTTSKGVRLDVPVVRGFRLMAMLPMNCAHWPPG